MGSKRKLVNGSDNSDSDGSGEEESQLDLERSIKDLCREDAPQLGDRKMSMAKKVELIFQLEEARQEEADLERMARRMAWRREVQRKIAGNAEFKEIMEEVPLKDVEVEEKPKMSMLSLEWREVFKKDRASFLLPEALKVMLSSELLTKRPFKSYYSKKAKDDDPDIILKWRLVSKSVKQAIDDLHSNDAFMSYVFSGFPTLRITEMKDAINFTKKLCYDVNPFVFRRIHIQWAIYESRHEFWKRTKIILARWGKEIWSASITFNDLQPDWEISSDYDLLVTCAKLMPNLRSLFICGGFENTDLKELKDHIATNPLPELPNLRFVGSAAGGYDIREGVEAETGPSIITYSLLSRYNRDLESCDLEFFNMTLPLESHFPSLQKLTMNFRMVRGMDRLVNMNLFKGLNNWGTQLKELALEVGKYDFYWLPHKSRSDALNGLFLELPHLETLSLELHFLPLETLDILLPCKSLKTIIYTATQYRDDLDPWAAQDDEGIFQFPNPSNLYESNVWKLLPELKLIKMDITTRRLPDEPTSVPYQATKTGQYTRDGYQQHCNLQNVKNETMD